MGDGSCPETRGVVGPLADVAEVGSGEGGLEDICVSGRADGKTSVDNDTFFPRVCQHRAKEGSTRDRRLATGYET